MHAESIAKRKPAFQLKKRRFSDDADMFCVVYVPTVLRFCSFLSVFVSSSDSRRVKVMFLFLQRT